MSIKEWLDIELKHSKTDQSDVIWGRRVIHAIDNDDCVRLSELMDKRKHPKADLNIQTKFSGYAGYIWTISIHKFLGDTALHYSLKQSKHYCVYMLVHLGADVHLKNEAGEIADTMIQDIYSMTVDNMRYDSKRKILDHLTIKEFNRLPKSFHCSKVEEEAWNMIHNGRIIFSELPEILKSSREVDRVTVSHATRKTLSFNAKSKMAQEVLAFQHNLDSGINEFEPTEIKSIAERTTQSKSTASANMKKKPQKTPWRRLKTEDGYYYYFNKV
jgi:hypothetical protein